MELVLAYNIENLILLNSLISVVYYWANSFLFHRKNRCFPNWVEVHANSVQTWYYQTINKKIKKLYYIILRLLYRNFKSRIKIFLFRCNPTECFNYAKILIFALFALLINSLLKERISRQIKK